MLAGWTVNHRDLSDRVIALLYKATLDDAHWQAASNLIVDACEIKGHGLFVGAGFGANAEILAAGFYYPDQRRQDLERLYFENYYPRDERVPRLRRLPDSKLLHMAELHTEKELKCSPGYNEALPFVSAQNGLNVRLDGPEGIRIVWTPGDPVDGTGWGSTQLRMIQRLLPHIRQFVCVRRVMASSHGLGASLTELLDNTQVGVIHLDHQGRILEANDHAREILLRRDGLYERRGLLGAWLPTDDANLQRVLGRALPIFGAEAPAGGSTTVRRSQGLPRLAIHITPVTGVQLNFGVPRVAAMALLVDPGNRPRIDATLVAETFGLSVSESEVAAMLAEGRTVHDIAEATGRRRNAVHFLLKRTYRKLGISRQPDLVRLVLSLSGLPGPRR